MDLTLFLLDSSLGFMVFVMKGIFYFSIMFLNLVVRNNSILYISLIIAIVFYLFF